jgi:hypothetical protein
MKGKDVSLFIFHLLSIDPIFIGIPDPSLMTSPCEVMLHAKDQSVRSCAEGQQAKMLQQ